MSKIVVPQRSIVLEDHQSDSRPIVCDRLKDPLTFPALPAFDRGAGLLPPFTVSS
jgi:hypothetical protein